MNGPARYAQAHRGSVRSWPVAPCWPTFSISRGGKKPDVSSGILLFYIINGGK